MKANTMRAELREQRRVIEQQRLELDRQQRRIDIQFRRTADVQAEVDLLKALLLRQGANLRPTQSQATPSNGHSHQAVKRTKLPTGWRAPER